MKTAELRDMSVDSLKEKVNELQETLFNLRFQSALSGLESPTKIRSVRRYIARAMTIINEKSNA